MKKLVMLMMAMMLLVPMQVSAADWSSEIGGYWLLDEEYQVEKAIDSCVAMYGMTKSAEQCSYKAVEGYTSVIASMLFMFEAEDQGVDVSEAEFCLEKALNKHWDTNTNTANWYRVNRVAAQCFEYLTSD